MGPVRIKPTSAFYLFVLNFALIIGGGFSSTVEHKVFCTAKEMTVTIILPDTKAQVYIDKLKGYPDCKPVIEGNRATFHLSLEDFYTCGTTRVSDAKGRKLFYNKIVVEVNKTIKDKIRAKCEIHGRNLLQFNRQRRDVLPEGFVEPDNINITGTVIGIGAVPDLNVGVRQNGNYIDTQLNVQPGTPLEMEVYLDQNSSTTYGLLVTSMNVTDKSPGISEIIIFKGCSIDPYLFSNFELQDDNSVMARFRAFKFPESSYVLFIGSVSICIGPCQGIPCSNGQIGYGRRKRDLLNLSREEIDFSRETYRDPNQIFEVTMTTILKVNESENQFVNKATMRAVVETEENPTVIAVEEIEQDIDNSLFERNVTGNWCQTQHLSKFLTVAVFLSHVFRSIL